MTTPTLYNWLGPPTFGAKVGGTGCTLWYRRPDNTLDPARISATDDLTGFFADCRKANNRTILDDPYNVFTNDELLTAYETLNREYRKTSRANLRIACYDRPGTPAWLTEEYVRDIVELSNHPIAKRLWAYCPSFYRWDDYENMAEWHSRTTGRLRVCRLAAAALDVLLLPVISGVPSVGGGRATPAQVVEMATRMRDEGVDCAVFGATQDEAGALGVFGKRAA